MPTIDDHRSFGERLARWAGTVVVKAPRDRPDALLLVFISALAFLLIAAVSAFNGYLFG